MNSFLKYFLLIISSFSFAQEQTGKAAIFLDEQFIHNNTFKYIDPSNIQEVKFKTDDITIKGETYIGQLFVSTKSKNYKFLSLEEIKLEFTQSKNSKILFIIEGELVEDKLETYKIDKEYILKVTVQNSNYIESLKAYNLNIDVVQIMLKTPDNLEYEKE